MRHIHVHIGEVKVGKGQDVLHTLLGSCVGIGLVWKARSVCGLAHCLLAEQPEKSYEISGRFVTQAVPSLMALLRIREEQISEIFAVVAGGGSMMGDPRGGSMNEIGKNNVLAAERELGRLGIAVAAKETGGDTGRRLILHCADGAWRIEKIPRFAIEEGK